MKKILKGLLCVVIACVCVFNLTGCKTKISATTTDASKTVYGGQATNGGITLVHDGYLYFVNGTKTNDGTSATGNTMSAICKVKINDKGEIDDKTYEVVVDNLVGFNYGSMSIFGDFLYFTTPNDDVNYQNAKLYNQTKFMRYDLVNKKTYTLFTTSINDSSETLAYEYYVVGNDLVLLVYESKNATITSVTIGEEPIVNYVITDVKSCVLSENYGTCVTKDKEVDANSFVFYTKGVDVYEDGRSDGNKVYKTSPVKDNSVCIADSNKSISLLSIRAGKLIYACKSISLNEEIIYTQQITDSTTEQLNFTGIISYSKYINIIFVENDDASVSALCFDDKTNQILWLNKSVENPYEIQPIAINKLEISSSSSSNSSSSSSSSSSSKVTFIGISTLTEEIETDEELEEGQEPETEEVKYLTYIVSNIVYKIEIMRDGKISEYVDPVKLSKSSATAPAGTIAPETIGNYLYFFANEVDDKNAETKKVYLHRVDLTIEDNSTEFATKIAKTEA